MILYHGSNVDIETIDLSKSKPYKDFGRDSICQQTKRKHSEWPSNGHPSN